MRAVGVAVGRAGLGQASVGRINGRGTRASRGVGGARGGRGGGRRRRGGARGLRGRGRSDCAASAGRARRCGRSLTGRVTTKVENNNVGLGARGDSDNTASGTTSTGEDIRSVHLIDTHGGRIDTAGKAIAAIAIAQNFNTKFGLDVAEGSSGLQVDRIPADLDVGVAIGNGVGAGSVGDPVTGGVGAGTPDASLLNTNTGGIDVVLRSGLAPVRHAGDGESGKFLDQGWDQHGLVTRQDSLAESHRLAGLVRDLHSTSTILTVGVAGERLLDLAILVTVKTTVLYGCQ